MSIQTKTKVHSSEYIQTLKMLGYEFRLNQCDNLIEVNGDPISDALESKIARDLRDKGYIEVNVAKDAYIAHALENAYHPIKDYLNNLSGWTGEDHISKLASYFDNPDGTFPIFLKRWLIGAVRRVFEEGAQNRMLVLESKDQGIGKSYFVRWLCPEHLRNKHYKENPINPDDKDDKIALMKTWIWEPAELGRTTRKADREALKHLISQELVTARMPYGRNPITKPALTSFMGTLNSEGGVLTDPTGNRRFMFCKIESIDWEYSTSINVDDIWAQAVMLYYAGEPADLTPEERELANQNNDNYQVENPLEGILAKYFWVDPSRKDWWTPSTEIVEILLDPRIGEYKSTTTQTTRDLTTLMTFLKCEKKRQRPPSFTNPVWGYYGIAKNDSAIALKMASKPY
jgi:predicted P-loop ATPase